MAKKKLPPWLEKKAPPEKKGEKKLPPWLNKEEPEKKPKPKGKAKPLVKKGK